MHDAPAPRPSRRAARRPAVESATPQVAIDGDAIARGDRVRHSHWGTGTVEEVVGAGDRAEAIVTFDDQGEKRLLLAWAPLEKV